MTREEWDNCEDLQALRQHIWECYNLDNSILDELTRQMKEYHQACQLRFQDLLPDERSRKYLKSLEDFSLGRIDFCRLENDDYYAGQVCYLFTSRKPADIKLIDQWVQEFLSKEHQPHITEWLKQYSPRELLQCAASAIRSYQFEPYLTNVNSSTMYDDVNVFRTHFSYREPKWNPLSTSVIKPMKNGWIKFSIDETWHVVWVVRWEGSDYFRHAMGDGRTGNLVTDGLAERRFHQGRTQSWWLPILFPQRALMLNKRSINCVTAAIRAFIRGWCYFP
jgi:hypothetical protein